MLFVGLAFLCWLVGYAWGMTNAVRTLQSIAYAARCVDGVNFGFMRGPESEKHAAIRLFLDHSWCYQTYGLPSITRGDVYRLTGLDDRHLVP